MNYVEVEITMKALVPVLAESNELATIEAAYKLDQDLNVKQEMVLMDCQGTETVVRIMELTDTKFDGLVGE